MAEFEIIEYQGRKIHQLDLRGDGQSNEEEVLEAIDEMEDAVTSQPENSVLALTLVRDTSYNKEILKRLKSLTKANKPYIEKSAVVGVSGLQKVALSGVKKFSGREFEQFDSVEEAKDYLVE
ncbi:MAG: hypothetical protein ABEJ69_02535 [Candidatus Nanohaloarchaea archaeon]